MTQRRHKGDGGRPEGACLHDHTHEGEPVTLLDGSTVGHVCRHCLVRLVGSGQLSSGQPAAWMPYSDDGRPLPMLPDTTFRERR